MDHRKLILAALLLGLGTCVLPAQGPLTPTGAPGATMRTLQQIQPRTPLETLPITITEPGTYYLTKNWNLSGLVPGAAAILVDADDVTIDLNGFTLSEISSSGVAATTAHTNLTVQNGVIRNLGGGGISAGPVSNAVINNVTIRDKGGAGVITGAGARVIDCTVRGGPRGIMVGARSLVRDCVVEEIKVVSAVLKGTGITAMESVCTIEDCQVSNVDLGITLYRGTARNVLLKDADYGIDITEGTLEGAYILQGGFYGIKAVDSTLKDVDVRNHTGASITATRCTVENVYVVAGVNGVVGVNSILKDIFVTGTSEAGILLTYSSIDGGYSRSNKYGYQMSRSQGRDCIAIGSTEIGFLASDQSHLVGSSAYTSAQQGFSGSGWNLQDCEAVGNGLNGFATSDSVLENCRSSNNSRSGFVLDNSHALRLTAKNNTEAGIEAGNRTQLLDSDVQDNGKSGIITGDGCQIRGNHLARNGASSSTSYANISVGGTRNSVTGNFAYAEAGNNDFGVQVTGSRNVVTGNTAGGHIGGGAGDADFNNVGSSNFIGQVLNLSSSNNSTAAHANFRMN